MTEEKSLRGKKSRAAGARFETKVRAHLEEIGWTVCKWMNTVDYEKNSLAPAKRKFNPFFKVLGMGVGFPDFVCFKRRAKNKDSFEVIGLEVKANGYIDQKEKGMCLWLIEHKIFSRILIAKKGKKRGEIEYIDFEKKYTSQ